MLVNKLKYRKTKEKKVLHKVKKQWVVLGTAALTILAAGAGSPEVVNADANVSSNLTNNQTSSGDEGSSAETTKSSAAESSSGSTSTSSASTGSSTNSSTDSNATSSSASVTTSSTAVTSNDFQVSAPSSTPAEDGLLEYRLEGVDAASTPDSNVVSNASLVDSAPSIEKAFYVGSGYSYTGNNSSTTYSFFMQHALSGAASVYNAKMTLQPASKTINGQTYSYNEAIVFANDASGNPFFTSGAASAFSNLSVYYADSANSVISSSAIPSDQMGSYFTFIYSNADFSSNSTASVLLFSMPSDFNSNIDLKLGETAGWSITFDHSAGLNSDYNSRAANDRNTNNHSDPTISPVGGGASFNQDVGSVATFDYHFAGNSSANGLPSTQYLTGSYIYSGNSFSVAVPSIAGYTFTSAAANVGNVSASADASGSSYVTGTIGYMQLVSLYYNPVTVSDTFNFYDENNSNAALPSASSVTVSGDYSSAVGSLALPAGYELGSNADNNSLNGLTFGTSNATYSVYLKHQILSYSAGVSGVADATKSQAYTRTVNYVDNNGSAISAASTFTSAFTQTATSYDAVTKQVTAYGDWTPGSLVFPAVSDSITGYTLTSSAPAQNVTLNDNESAFSVNVVYSENSVADTFNYVDSNNSVVASVSVSGYPDKYVDTTSLLSSAPSNYVFASGANTSFSGLKFGTSGSTYTVSLADKTQSFSAGDSDFSGTNLSAGDFSKTVTQTVSYLVAGTNTPVQSATSSSVTFTRGGTYNYVTKSTAYSNWDSASATFPSVSTSLSGYTVTSSAAAQTVLANDSDTAVSTAVLYSENSVVDTFNYVDSNNSVVASVSVSGYPSSIVDTNSLLSSAPSNYVFASGANTSFSGLKFGTSGSTYTVSLADKTQSFSAGDSDFSGTNLSAGDFSKTVTQTVSYLVSGTNTPVQSATSSSVMFTRGGTYNYVTKSTAYSDWSPSSASFSSVDTSVAGYTVTSSAAAQTVLANDSDTAVSTAVLYSENSVVDTFNYVDSNNSVVASVSVSGYPSSSVDTNSLLSSAPSNYVFASGANTSFSGLKFGTSGSTYTVSLADKTQSFSAGDSDFSGTTLSAGDFSKTVTQTVSYLVSGTNTPVQSATSSSVTFTRGGTYNYVTKSTAYSDWSPSSASFSSVDTSVAGYTVTSSAAAQTVLANDSNTAVSTAVLYLENSVADTFNYYDGNSVVGSTVTVSGYPSSAVDVKTITDSVPENYELASGVATSLDSLTFGTSAGSYAVSLAHKTKTFSAGDTNFSGTSFSAGDFTQTYTRTVNYLVSGTNNSLQPATTETVTFTREGIYDYVTKQSSYTSWSPESSSFAAVAPSISGYQVVSSAPVSTVNPNGADFTSSVDVTYSKNPAASSTSATQSSSSDDGYVSYANSVGRLSGAFVISSLNGSFVTDSNYSSASATSTTNASSSNDSSSSAVGFVPSTDFPQYMEKVKNDSLSKSSEFKRGTGTTKEEVTKAKNAVKKAKAKLAKAKTAKAKKTAKVKLAKAEKKYTKVAKLYAAEK